MNQDSPPTSVVHVEGEDTHAVLIQSLRVIIMREGDQWFAQGLELDYAAAGESQDDVKSRFENGLSATISEHLKVYGSVEKILKVAPQDAWNLWLTERHRYKLDHTSFHAIGADEATVGFPFSGIAYLEPPSLPLAA